jgi:hypothetical protein
MKRRLKLKEETKDQAQTAHKVAKSRSKIVSVDDI